MRTRSGPVALSIGLIPTPRLPLTSFDHCWLRATLTMRLSSPILGLIGLPSSMREFMPAGDFQISFQGQSSASGYERWLDLSDGTAGSTIKRAL